MAALASQKMNVQKLDAIILRISGVLFTLGGLSHWLIIVGVLTEKCPRFIELYFHSLAIFGVAAGVGLVRLKDWGVKLGILICVTQFPPHLYMIYLDVFHDWNSGFGPVGRAIDLFLAALFLAYSSFRAARTKQHYIHTGRVTAPHPQSSQL